MNRVVEIKELSKLYRLGQIGTGTLSRDLSRLWSRAMGKEDPYQKIGEVNNRSVKGSSEFVWSLKDINFELKKGEVLGIIGKNGAGKSTLLKILSRVTAPTHGYINAKGRIASLLEVGTGFHPDLTGKENIFLNGAILGMRKAEIKRKFEEIVEFAGVSRYIDTPVKRYSSGMTVRLGFAVAAHLESEILIVDEVLAVGDAEFQQKAIGKMQDLSSEGSRTVLFVSHNMPSVKSLCNRALLLKNGMVEYDGEVSTAIDKYLTGDTDMSLTGIIPVDMVRNNWSGEARFRQVILKDMKGEERNEFYFKSNFIVDLKLQVLKEITDAEISIMVGTLDGIRILFYDNSNEHPSGISLAQGNYNISLQISEFLLPGSYSVYLGLGHMKTGKTIEWIERVYDFHVLKASYEPGQHYRAVESHGYILNKESIKIHEI